MTRKQSNNQWSGGIAAHPAPKNSVNIRWKISRLPRFFGIKTASFSLIIFQWAKLSMRSITHLCWCKWRTFWKKNAGGKVTEWVLRGSCSRTKMPRFTGHLHPEETSLPGLPVSWSPTLFSGTGPVGLPPFPWTEKRIERSPFFVRRGGPCCCGDLVRRTTFWIFFEWLA